jgi:hypothetical protein
MNPLQRTLIEKTGNDNGFEHVLASDRNGVTLASARHPTRALVGLEDGAYQVHFHATTPTLLPELQRSFPQPSVEYGGFRPATEAALAANKRWQQNWQSFPQALSVLRLSAWFASVSGKTSFVRRCWTTGVARVL